MFVVVRCCSFVVRSSLHGTTAKVGTGLTSLKATHVFASTFGPSAGSTGLPSTDNYLKKGSRDDRSPKKSPGKKFDRTMESTKSTKPTVPRRGDKPVMGLRTSKNFITANAVEAILSVPSQPTAKRVDYLGKDDYGQVPDYLGQVKEEIRRENDMIDSYVTAQMAAGEDNPPEFDELPESDRSQLLENLKRKWDAVNSRYQKAAHKVDFTSRGDINRKEGQEAELKRLENDIMLLQRAGSVMIGE